MKCIYVYIYIRSIKPIQPIAAGLSSMVSRPSMAP